MNSTRLFRSVISRAGFCLILFSLLATAVFVPHVSAATFGTVVTIGGQASDIALDEPRGLLYIANFTANCIDVMSLSKNTIQTQINVPPQPGSLSLSPDGNYLVIVHFGNFVSPSAPANALTVISLNNNDAIQTFALGAPPLGVAFGIDGLALVVTTTNFLLFDPTNGQTTVLATIADVSANTLPVAPANFPPNIVSASLNVSADGFNVYGLTNTMFFHYGVLNHSVQIVDYTSVPTLGPLAVSVASDGSTFTAGWALFSAAGILNAEFPSPVGTYNIGSTAISSSAGLIYAQVPQSTTTTTTSTSPIPSTSTAPQTSVAPVLQVVAADNLSVQQNLQIPENLAGKSVLTAKQDMLYSISQSGVTVFPVGYLASINRVQASQPDVVFRGNLCNSGVMKAKITILDPGGNQTDFTLTPSISGINLSQYAGTTPATITVSIDPASFQNLSGTVTASISISSNLAINVPNPIRVLINGQGPDQRGAFFDVPGTLVDVLADPVRNRFYLLRQDQDQVIVFDSAGENQLAVLRTGNTPTSMAMTTDQNYLLVGHDNSQLISVFNLNTLQPSVPIPMPFGHYPRQVAVSSNGILVASRVAGTTHTFDFVDFLSRSSYTPTTAGIFTNSINIDTALSSSPGGRYIFGAGADGTTWLYDASAGTFVAARKDFSSLSGAHSASDYGKFVAGVNELNASLVLTNTLDSSIGSPSGAAFSGPTGYRTTAPSTVGAPGVIEQISTPGSVLRPTNMVEAPLLANGVSSFTRTLAPLISQSGLVSLTTSGFTLLPWSYDAAIVPPKLNKVVNAADFTSGIAPGGLISIMGSNLSPVNLATSEIPLPTILGDSCLMINGAPVPMLYVSAKQINAQLPFDVDGNATLVLYTPGGVSPTMDLTIASNAPSVFRDGTAGPQTGIATIYRNSDNKLVTLSNPIHPKDTLTIYATGLGVVEPPVANGAAGPKNPLAVALTPAEVTLGGTVLNVQYAGLAPGQVGVYAIVAVVPSKIETGMSVPIVISQGGASTTLHVRVVN